MGGADGADGDRMERGGVNRTTVDIEPDGTVRFGCDACDYYAKVPKSEIARPLGDCLVGSAVLSVIFHVEHIHNDKTVKELSA